ncbi:MAG: deoxyribodipyrimidine photo-lyase [Endozoicomonas sp.]
MEKKRQLVWLRSDLRVSDNKALYNASLEGPVVCVFLLCPEQWREHGDGANKLFFFLKHLKHLESSLLKLNIPVIVRYVDWFAGCPKELLKLARELDCQGIWFNDQYGLNEQNRDINVEHLFLQQGFQCHRFTDQILFRPGSLLNGKGEYFKVFTPFRKHLYKQLSPNSIQPLPQPAKQSQQQIKTASDNNYAELYTPTATYIDRYWPVGEQAAQKRLQSFIFGHAQQYEESRDYPSLDGTSSLSPWLNVGAISIRQCFYDAFMANDGVLDTGNPGLVCWMSELIWREFYKHILSGFPRLSMGRAFKEETDRLPWIQNNAHYEAWKNGRTGIPIVDAAMKQLVQTGWMHNRLRMVTAMFLSKNLMLDWRLGERFFMEHLIDGDLAANNGGWQWSSSTGTDAAPYFRMFNPESQSRKFDESGAFIRQWLPELSGLDNKSIHAPSAAAENIHLDYPEPVIDLKASRARVLGAFKSLN